MYGHTSMTLHIYPRTSLLFLISTIIAAPQPAGADIYAPVQPDHVQLRLIDKKQELQREQEKFVAKTDRLYTEIHARPRRSWAENHVWDLLAIFLITAVCGGTFWYLRRQHRSRAAKRRSRMSSRTPVYVAPEQKPDYDQIAVLQNRSSQFLSLMFDGDQTSNRQRIRSRSRRNSQP